VGVAWLLVLLAAAWLRIDDVIPTPEVKGIVVPTLMLIGGALAGLLAGWLFRLLNGAGGRRRSRVAEKALRARVAEVAGELVVAPVEEEVRARDALCRALDRARG
jgi:hypothetical protein